MNYSDSSFTIFTIFGLYLKIEIWPLNKEKDKISDSDHKNSSDTFMFSSEVVAGMNASSGFKQYTTGSP